LPFAVPRSLQDLLQSLSDVMFPSDPERRVAIDSVGYDGDTPLHVMAWRNDLESVRMLIAAGADVNAQGEMDETPLHVAIRQGNLPMISAMLEAGARDDIGSEFGETPRECALKKGGAVAGLFGKGR
jgi:ankyrin repeat protein